MHYILQNNLFHEDGMVRLKDCLDRFGLPYSEHKVIPFIGELDPEPKLDTNDVICFGSYSMRHYAKKMGWNPGVYDCEPYDHTILNNNWGTLMLNHDSVFCTFLHSASYVSLFVEKYGAAFIRPIHDTKTFAGTLVTDIKEFDVWHEKVCVLLEDDGSSLRSFTQVMIAPPKNIQQEYRLFIVDNRIATGSLYKQGDKILYKEIDDYEYNLMSGYLNIVLNNVWTPPLRSFVIDLAITDGKIKIIEINTMNSSGLYACDVQKLVIALEGKK